MIMENWDQFTRTFYRLMMNYGQASSVMVNRRPSYLKDFTVSISFPYAQNASSASAHASSFAGCCRFLSSPHAQSAVLVWSLFIASHRGKMPQKLQRVWGWLPSSRINTVSRMWPCTKSESVVWCASTITRRIPPLSIPPTRLPAERIPCIVWGVGV